MAQFQFIGAPLPILRSIQCEWRRKNANTLPAHHNQQRYAEKNWQEELLAVLTDFDRIMILFELVYVTKAEIVSDAGLQQYHGHSLRGRANDYLTFYSKHLFPPEEVYVLRRIYDDDTIKEQAVEEGFSLYPFAKILSESVDSRYLGYVAEVTAKDAYFYCMQIKQPEHTSKINLDSFIPKKVTGA